MRDTVTGRALSVYGGFQAALALYLRQRAAKAQEAVGGPFDSPGAQAHVEALLALETHVATADPADQSLWQLRELQGQLGGDTDTRSPGPEQSLLLSMIGMEVSKNPAAPDALAELVSAGLADYLGQHKELRRRLDEYRAKAEQLRPLEERITELEKELDETRAALSQLRDSESELREQRDYLRTLLPSEHSEPVPSSADRPKGASGFPRRRKVKGHTGIYQTPSGDFEIGWSEDGKQRWRLIGPDLDAAIEARAEATNPTPAAA